MRGNAAFRMVVVSASSVYKRAVLVTVRNAAMDQTARQATVGDIITRARRAAPA